MLELNTGLRVLRWDDNLVDDEETDGETGDEVLGVCVSPLGRRNAV